MKLIRRLSPKNLFGSKRDRSSISRSNPESFSSGTSSSTASDASSSTHKPHSGSGAADLGTPTSILPGTSGDWSDMHIELYEAFKMIDKDDDGFIPRTELETLLTRIGPKAEEISSMLSEVDGEGEGCVISLERLMNKVVFEACEPACESELKEVFECFDSDQDGRITAEDLLRFFSSIGDEGCTIEDSRRMIAGVDKKGDGFVCFEDFSRMMELPRR